VGMFCEIATYDPIPRRLEVHILIYPKLYPAP
jgi:hypothetical protein